VSLLLARGEANTASGQLVGFLVAVVLRGAVPNPSVGNLTSTHCAKLPVLTPTLGALGPSSLLLR
jgi:hypothetical protein